MAKEIRGRTLMLPRRDRSLAFTTPMEKLDTLSADDTIELDGMKITGIKTTHGELALRPGPNERVGWGALGFSISLHGTTIVSPGDTSFHEKEWELIINPDVLMIPMGGGPIHHTMGEANALRQ